MLRMRIQDGTHCTSSYFSGIFLICGSVDCNNQIKLLAFGRVGTENKENWIWFEENLQKDFPNTRYWDYAI